MLFPLYGTFHLPFEEVGIRRLMRSQILQVSRAYFLEGKELTGIIIDSKAWMGSVSRLVWVEGMGGGRGGSGEAG